MKQRLVLFLILPITFAACSQATPPPQIIVVTATDEPTVAATSTETPTALSISSVTEYEQCFEIHTPLLDTLDLLHLELEKDISFASYTNLVLSLKTLMDGYDLPREMWETDCRYVVSDPLAGAWKSHLKAWGMLDGCMHDNSCDTETIDAVTAAWDRAVEQVLLARDGLQSMQP